MNEEQVKKQKKLQAVQNWIEKRKTGKIEQWPGKKNLMITAFLKENGATPGPKGTKFEKGTAHAFIKAQLESLKRSGFYLRATYTVPDANTGAPTEQFGTLISITKGGDLVYSCRTRHNIDPDDVTVDFIDNSDDDEVADAIKDEEPVAEKVDDEDSTNLEIEG